MSVSEFITTMDVIALISSISSLILSIVAIVISILFYILGKNDSTEICSRAKEIESHTNTLKTLQETMLKTSFEMIRDNSKAMQDYVMASVGKTDTDSKKDDGLNNKVEVSNA